ncbi:MAG: hypothetical protein K2N90_12185 [Lachnospiraceae bacterium]|nr:hypothetical protein [Lachnospiraceae bacterium]
MKTKDRKNGIRAFIMMLIVWGVIECDFISLFLPNQILAFGISPVIWGVGVFCILSRMKQQSDKELYNRNDHFAGRDWLILFFAVTGGISIGARNYLYAGMAPLLIREFFSGYPLYTIRNIFYYPLEVLLMLELLIYAQRAGECLGRKSGMPWGALALFILWGLPHLFHGFEDGMISALNAFVYAIPFYASGKKRKVSYVSMLILWLLV